MLWVPSQFEGHEGEECFVHSHCYHMVALEILLLAAFQIVLALPAISWWPCLQDFGCMDCFYAAYYLAVYRNAREYRG